MVLIVLADKNGWQEEDFTGKPSSPEPEVFEEAGPKLSRKELRRKRSEILAERAKLLKPIEKKIAAAENEIDSREKELARLNEEMLPASQSGDGAKIVLLSQKLHACQSVIDKRFDDLEALTEELETQSAGFDAQLQAFEAAE